MTPEITELIKKKTEEIYPNVKREQFSTFEEFESVFITNAEKRTAYTTGQIEAIEMMIGFMLWTDDNYWRLGNKDEWVYEIGEDDSPVFTTIELLTKYIKENGASL